MAVKLFQARDPAFQRLQLPLLLAQPHRTSFRLGRGAVARFLVDGPRDHGVVFSFNPLEFEHLRKEGVLLSNSTTVR
jgi:hypothetical protein